MIDTHCHLNFKAFENDYDTVIKDAKEAGIDAIINVGTQISSSKLAVDLANKYENLYAIIGIHPHHADKLNVIARSATIVGEEAIPASPAGRSTNNGIAAAISRPRNDNNNWLKELEKLAAHPRVVGIGECGLDYFAYKSNGIVDPTLQKKVFIEHLGLAHKLKLPLQIHSRDENARKDVLGMLEVYKDLLLPIPGMFHCMAGSLESLKSALQMGFYVGFDGNITYKGIPKGEPESLVELVKYTPIDRIVIETDSPYLTPVPYRRQRNEPKYAIITGEYIAKIKKVPFEQIVEQTDKNAYTIFSKLRK